MKRKSVIIYVFFLTAMVQGCNLDLFPQDSVSPETYFKSAKDCELWSNGFYTMLNSADNSAGYDADDVIDNTLETYIAGTRSPSSENGWTWGQLRNINYMLEHLDNCEDPAVRREYEGVCRFFRAYFYFEKVKRYGDVPWYGQVLGSSDAGLYKARDDRGFVMDKVLEDFDAAIEWLPSVKNVARVTKWTALAFKSRAALFEGTFRKYHGLGDAEKYLEQAAAAAEQVMSSGGYSLYSEGSEPYRDLFVSDNAIESEVILARIYNNADLNIAHSIQANILQTKQGFTKRFMNHYLMADGRRFSDVEGYDTMEYYEETASRDPRMAQTVLCPGYVQKGTTKVASNNLQSRTGYQPVKFIDVPSRNSASQGTSDFPLMRIAEVYLNFAEAKAELGTVTQQDLDKSVCKIRARAKMPSLNLDKANAEADRLLLEYYPNVTKSSCTGVILEIRRERTVELVMEGQRPWDMIRWKEGARMVNTPNAYMGCWFPGPGAYDMDHDGTVDVELYYGNPTSSAPYKYPLGTPEGIVLSEGDHGCMVAYSQNVYTWNENRDYLWPIPVSERELTGGVLTQNPGWGDGLEF